MSGELKPCPFCGGYPKMGVMHDDEYGSNVVGITIACKTHAAQWAETREHAIQLWNARAEPTIDVEGLRVDVVNAVFKYWNPALRVGQTETVEAIDSAFKKYTRAGETQ